MRGRRQQGVERNCGRTCLPWCLAALLWVGLGAGAAEAQDDLPGDDPAAWLVEASVQARRISGVGDELTRALQTKGALLAHIAVAQQAIGEDAAAARNQQIVNLCLRALAHDGEDGWVHAAQAHALIEHGRPEDAQESLQQISNADEQAAARAWIDAEPVAANTTNGVGLGFASQRDWFATYQAIRGEAATVARHGTVRDAQVWVGVLNDPAERAWASVGVAQGLREAASVSAGDAASPPEATQAIDEVDPPAATKIDAAPEIVAPSENTTPPEIQVSASPEMVVPAAAVSVPLIVVEPTHESAGVEIVVSPETPVTPVTPETPETPTAIKTATVPETTDDIGGFVPDSVEGDFVPEPPAPNRSAPAAEIAPALIPVVPDLKTLADPSAVLSDEPAPQVYDIEFTTTKGAFTVRVHRDWAPLAADRFRDLAVSGFYHNQRFFRVVPGFVVQWGIHGYPDVAAAWRPQTLLDEPRTQPNRRGTIAFAAATQPRTRTTQVFINLADNAFLDDLGFVPFGEITAGMDVVESLFGGYGETPSQKQREIQLQGNAFLDARYPKLDSILSVQMSPAE